MAYSRQNVSALAEIADQKAALRTVYIVTIVLASLSMISVVVLAIVSRLKGKKGVERELNDTLITSEATSSSIKV